VPGLLAVLFCVLLYWLLISPLEHLRRQANAMRADPLGNAAQISPLPDYAALSIITRHCHYLSQATR